MQVRKINLEDPINKYLKSLAINSYGRESKAYKVFHLLNMAAGVPHSFRYCYASSGDLTACGRNSASASAFSGVRSRRGSPLSRILLSVSPLSWWRMSQVNRLVISCEAKSFSRREWRVHLPIGMRSQPKIKRLARGYRSDGSPAADFQFEPSGGGGFYSTVNDLLNYGAVHLGESKDSRRVHRSREPSRTPRTAVRLLRQWLGGSRSAQERSDADLELWQQKGRHLRCWFCER